MLSGSCWQCGEHAIGTQQVKPFIAAAFSAHQVISSRDQLLVRGGAGVDYIL